MTVQLIKLKGKIKTKNTINIQKYCYPEIKNMSEKGLTL